jgi:hypothetical protein
VTQSSNAVFVFAIVVSGCARYRTIPVTEASKVSYENVPRSGGVVVEDVDGERIRIDHFRFVEVLFVKCQKMRLSKKLYCYDDKIRYSAPVFLHRDGERLLVVPNSADPRNTQPRWFETAKAVRVVDKDLLRGLMMTGTALAIFTAVSVRTTYALSQSWTLDRKWHARDPHGVGPLLLGLFIGIGAGGASLLVTGPLTRELGDPAP